MDCMDEGVDLGMDQNDDIVFFLGGYGWKGLR